MADPRLAFEYVACVLDRVLVEDLQVAVVGFAYGGDADVVHDCEFGCKDTFFSRYGEIFLAVWGKVCIFAVDFRRKSRGVILALASGNVRNFYEMQGWYDGLRVLAWTVSISSFQGNSHGLH